MTIIVTEPGLLTGFFAYNLIDKAKFVRLAFMMLMDRKMETYIN